MSERVNRGELIAGIGGLVLILTMFLFAWFGVEGARGGDAFDVFGDWVNIILVFTAFLAMALAFFGADVARADLPLSVIVTVLGAVSAVIIFIYILSPPNPFGSIGDVGGVEFTIDVGRKFGVFLGLASAIAIAVGGYLAMQEEGVSFGDTADRLGGSSTPQPPTTTPPPPPPPPSQQQPPTQQQPPPQPPTSPPGDSAA
jgi:hypothetical protein